MIKFIKSIIYRIKRIWMSRKPVKDAYKYYQSCNKGKLIDLIVAATGRLQQQPASISSEYRKTLRKESKKKLIRTLLIMLQAADQRNLNIKKGA